MKSANDVKGVHDAPFLSGHDLEKHEPVQIPTRSNVRSRWSRFRVLIGLALGYELLKFGVNVYCSERDAAQSWAYQAYNEEPVLGKKAEELFLFVSLSIQHR